MRYPKNLHRVLHKSRPTEAKNRQLRSCRPRPQKQQRSHTDPSTLSLENENDTPSNQPATLSPPSFTSFALHGHCRYASLRDTPLPCHLIVTIIFEPQNSLARLQILIPFGLFVTRSSCRVHSMHNLPFGIMKTGKGQIEAPPVLPDEARLSRKEIARHVTVDLRGFRSASSRNAVVAHQAQWRFHSGQVRPPMDCKRRMMKHTLARPLRGTGPFPAKLSWRIPLRSPIHSRPSPSASYPSPSCDSE